MFKSQLSKVVKTAVTSALVSAVLASPAMAAKPSKPAYQDLEITGVLQEIVGPSLRCASKFGGTILGFGSSPTLGKLGFVANDCITPNGAGFTFSDGYFVITTLTGEQIYATYGGQFVPTGEGSKFVFNGATFQVTGGTGRYFKASGGGDLTGGEDMTTGQGNITLKGRILLKK